MRQARGFAARGSIRIKAMYESTAPLRRSCTAEAVLWLIDGARAVTGELPLLDSGMHLGATQTAIPGKP